MPHILIQFREVEATHAPSRLVRESRVIGHEGGNGVGDHDTIQRGQLFFEDRLAGLGVITVEEMRTVLLSKIMQGVGDAA